MECLHGIICQLRIKLVRFVPKRLKPVQDERGLNCFCWVISKALPLTHCRKCVFVEVGHHLSILLH